MVCETNHLLRLQLGFESRSPAVYWPKYIKAPLNTLIHNLQLVERGVVFHYCPRYKVFLMHKWLFQQLTYSLQTWTLSWFNGLSIKPWCRCIFPTYCYRYTLALPSTSKEFYLAFHRPHSTLLFRDTVANTDNKFNLIELQPNITWIKGYRSLYKSAKFQLPTSPRSELAFLENYIK
jgi:hypothetical protein